MKSGIGGKSFEGQHLRAEVLESKVSRFITPSAVSPTKDRLSMTRIERFFHSMG